VAAPVTTYYYKEASGGLVQVDRSGTFVLPAGATALTLAQYNSQVAAAEAAYATQQASTKSTERTLNRMTNSAPVRIVASASAPDWVKAATTYVATGTADQVTIQQAVDAAFAEGGGTVQLSQGIFYQSAPITLHPRVKLLGMHGDQIFNPGQFVVASYLKPVPGPGGRWLHGEEC
jgi:polygalacturonase